MVILGIGIKSSGLKVNKWVMLEAFITARSLIS
jgi:hypothetical protein